MVSLDKINTSLKTVKNTVNITELNNKGIQSSNDFNSLFKAKGKKVGDIIDGFEVVADEGLDLEKDTLSPIVGKISEDVALELKKTSTQKSNIATITGISVDDGFLESAISNTNPLGIDKTLNKISNDTSGITSVIQNFSVGTNASLADALLNNLSAQGVANNFVTEFTNINEVVSNLTSFLQSDLGVNITDAVTGDTNTNSVIETNLPFTLSVDEVIVNSVKDFNGKNTSDDYQFTFVSTVEELMLEFRNSEREFSQIIIEYTEEFLDDNFEAKDFQELYSSENFAPFDGIPYHYLIRKDGRIQRGRPLDIAANYPSRIDYKNAVVVALPAGFNVPIGTENAKLAVNSGTTSSWYSLQTLLEVAYNMFPGIQVYASPELNDIGFSADTYIETLFGKKNNKQASANTITRQDLIDTEIE
jgi:hypothetical protein|tara:strand:- start:12158 stop:13414 length:1257 start_codon:yes stop_codon:yes gene_type:complete